MQEERINIYHKNLYSSGAPLDDSQTRRVSSPSLYKKVRSN